MSITSISTWAATNTASTIDKSTPDRAARRLSGVDPGRDRITSRRHLILEERDPARRRRLERDRRRRLIIKQLRFGRRAAPLTQRANDETSSLMRQLDHDDIVDAHRVMRLHPVAAADTDAGFGAEPRGQRARAREPREPQPFIKA
jgi:hypothetical protein